MPSDADLRILETLLARGKITAAEAAHVLAAWRERGALDLALELLSLRAWSEADRAELSAVFRSVAGSHAPATIADSGGGPSAPATVAHSSGPPYVPATIADSRSGQPAPSTAADVPSSRGGAASTGASARSAAGTAQSSHAGIPPPSHVVGAPTPEPGRRPFAFERYEVIQEIARGGMGVVYKARDTRLGRIVALKVLVGGTSASPESIERFHREARTIAGLQHPRIVPVHDVGETDGACYFTMDFIEGPSLARLIHDRAIARRDGVALLREIALALHHAHEQGVVHRDVKPGNILVDRSGRAFIADFGLAREAQSDSRLTATGRPVGTPVYMSPEQAGGDPTASDRRVDVYALGATLFEMLTGRPPYEGENMMEILFKILGSDPPRPTMLDPTIPRDLEIITLRAMERERGRRYPTAKAFADDLGRFLEGEAIAARPSGVLYRSWKKARRHPVAATLGTTGAILVALVGGFAAWTAAREALEARELAGRARTELAAGRPEEALTLLGRARTHDPDGEAWPVMEEACRAAIRARDERAREEARLAEALERNARRNRAQPLFEAAWKLLDLTDILARHGRHAQRRERLDEAAGLLDKALAEDAEFAEAWHARGRVRRLLGRPDLALADLDRAIALRGTFSAPWIERIGARADLYHRKSSPGVIVEQGDGPIQWNFRDLAQDAEAQALLAAAHADVERVLALGVRPEEAHFVKGLMSVVDGHPDAAIAELSHAIELFPYHAEAHQKRAFAHLMQGDTDAALADITRALELWPAFAEGLCYRGVIRFVRQDSAGAIADFETAGAIDPELRQAVEGKAMVLGTGGNWPAAIPEYSRAVEKWADANSYVNRGTAYLKCDRLAEARADFARAVELDASDPRAVFMRGQVRMVDGDLEGARADIEKAIELDPRDPYFCEALAWVHEKRNDAAAAKAAYDLAIARAPDAPKYYVMRAAVRRELRDFAGALADLDLALAKDPDDPRALFDRARMRLGIDRIDEARADLDRLIARRPDDPAARQLRARLRGQAGDHAGALEDLNAAVAAEPTEPSHRLFRGIAHLAAQRWAEAVADLEAGLAPGPQGPEAVVARTRLADARWLAAHPTHWHDLETAFRQLAEACNLAEQAYRRADWPAAAEAYQAGLDVTRALFAAKGPELQQVAEGNRSTATLLVHAWYNFACCLGRRAEAAQGAERDRIADEALAALLESLRLGFDDLDHVRNDPDLAVLRSRPEFQKALLGPK